MMNRIVEFGNEIFWPLVFGMVIGAVIGLVRFGLI